METFKRIATENGTDFDVQCASIDDDHRKTTENLLQVTKVTLLYVQFR